jgi:hypothetical protein
MEDYLDHTGRRRRVRLLGGTISSKPTQAIQPLLAPAVGPTSFTTRRLSHKAMISRGRAALNICSLVLRPTNIDNGGTCRRWRVAAIIGGTRRYQVRSGLSPPSARPFLTPQRLHHLEETGRPRHTHASCWVQAGGSLSAHRKALAHSKLEMSSSCFFGGLGGWRREKDLDVRDFRNPAGGALRFLSW